MVTTGKAWRKAREEGLEFLFPSGNTAAVRPIEIDCFLQVGRIPDLLAPMVLRFINGENVTMDIPASEQIEQSKEWLEFLNNLTRFAFVNPKVVDDPQGDDEISVDDVSYSDKTHLYRFIFGRPANRLMRFLEQINALATVGSKPVDGTTTQQATADKPVVQPSDGNAGHVDGRAA